MIAQRKAADILAKAALYDQKHLETRMGDVFERYGKFLETEELAVMEMQLKGGECESCGRGWVPRRVLNQALSEDRKTVVRTFADFTLYEPMCLCYKRCSTAGFQIQIKTKKGMKEVMRRRRGCDALLVVEKLMTLHGKEQKTCRNCGGIIL